MKTTLTLGLLMLASAAWGQTVNWQYNVYGDLHGKFNNRDACEASLEAAMAQRRIPKPWPNGVRCDSFTEYPKPKRIMSLVAPSGSGSVNRAPTGWEFNAGPGKGNWTPERNRADYSTKTDCEEALSDAMRDVPQPWPPGIRCAPYYMER